jgi:hypothetical protein
MGPAGPDFPDGPGVPLPPEIPGSPESPRGPYQHKKQYQSIYGKGLAIKWKSNTSNMQSCQ